MTRCGVIIGTQRVLSPDMVYDIFLHWHEPKLVCLVLVPNTVTARASAHARHVLGFESIVVSRFLVNNYSDKNEIHPDKHLRNK